MLKVVLAAAAFVLAASQPAIGALIFRAGIDLTGTGLGAVDPILVVQDNSAEAGCVAFGDVTGNAACFGTVATGGDEKPQTQTRTVGQSGAVSAGAFVVVLNPAEPSGNSITLEDLSVRFYSPAGAVLYTASLDLPVSFLNTDAGVGQSGFAFVLDPVQAAQAQVAGAFANPLNVIGISASLSDSGGAPDTFWVASRPAVGLLSDDPVVIPEPSTYLTLAAGLLMLGFSHRRLLGRG